MSQYEFIKVIALAWIDPKNYWKSNNKKITNNKTNDNDVITTRSKRTKKRKITYASNDSFKPNDNINHRMSISVERGL